MTNIRKKFPGIVALDDVRIRVKPGTVHALVGENGAGKSTLMKILMGLYQPDSGVIRYNGKTVVIPDIHTALKMNISIIHQELNPMLHMKVSENIWLGREPTNRFGFVNHKKMRSDTAALMDELKIDIDPDELMIELSVAKQQMVEIAKAISYQANLLVMDEPTSAITDKEIEHLFQAIRKIKSRGAGIIYISHKLDELFVIADEVTVLRDGRFIASDIIENLNKNTLISMMVGQKLDKMFPKEKAVISNVAFSVKNLSCGHLFSDISFDVKKGEILGIAGLMGAGRSEIIETIFGIRKKTSGDLFLNGEKIVIEHPKDAVARKMAFLTEDRKYSGLYLALTVRENMECASISSYIRKFFINHAKVKKDCELQVKNLSIKMTSLDQIIDYLSGGNQQKVLIARWLLTTPDILFLDEPTRGIDVGAKAEIHRLMSKLAGQGKSIVMISSELPEILGMSDRILVVHEGRMVGELFPESADQEMVLKLAFGETV